MDARMEVKDPLSIRFTVTMTMTLKEWLELNAQLEKSWPASSLSSTIQSMVRQAEKTYWDDSIKGVTPTT